MTTRVYKTPSRAYRITWIQTPGSCSCEPLFLSSQYEISGNRGFCPLQPSWKPSPFGDAQISVPQIFSQPPDLQIGRDTETQPRKQQHLGQRRSNSSQQRNDYPILCRIWISTQRLRREYAALGCPSSPGNTASCIFVSLKEISGNRTSSSLQD